MSTAGKDLHAAVLINPPAHLLGVTNAIFWGRAKQYHTPEIPGPLSIKSVVRGSARWETADAERLVDGSNYLVLNAGRTYSLTIDSRETVETFCLFFRHGLVEDAARVAGAKPETLLDSPLGAALTTPKAEFFETLHPTDSIVSPLVQQVYSRVAAKTASDAWLEDQFLTVAGALLTAHSEVGKRVSKLPAKKPATREELYRRLLRGRDYLDSFFTGPVSLAEVASEACLSPYHFHRLFREAFCETPNQYLQRKRLATAERLLSGGENSVTDICLEVGFESITSFSALFRRRFGFSPREYRHRKIESYTSSEQSTPISKAVRWYRRSRPLDAPKYWRK
jgi:AraC-like DNA-binding protein